TTHYKDVPTVVTKRNFTNPLSARLDTMLWSPRMALENYPDLPDYKKYFAFKHTFSRGNKDRYRWYKRSAQVNTEVTDMALEYITDLRMGRREVMDMLNIGYTVQPYPGARDSDTRLETMDAYLRLDRDLERLFRALDSAVGNDNVMVFMAGTPEMSCDRADDPRWNIPYGEFSPKKAMTLLRMYLIALHGNGEWVMGYHDRQFFLNEALIREKDLDIRAIRAESAAFLERMSGVSQAWTIDDAQSGHIGVRPDMLRRNTSVKLAGDVFISVNPGWEIYDDTQNGRTTRRLYRAMPTTAPVYIMMPGFESSRIETPVDVLSVAPTIARILRIRLPNAAENPTISTIFAPLLKK
ncbi:MAG: hypothetical protein K2M76_05935, partial [Muribaculaceae bacterium]|nr:hypothetical protein [Muribaculaceae bacterium]